MLATLLYSVTAAAVITPLPQCLERRQGVLTLSPDSALQSDDAFSAEWLADGIKTVCGTGGGPGRGSLSGAGSGRLWPGARAGVAVSLLLPGAAQTTALKQRGMDLSPQLGQEGYIIDADPTAGVLIAAHNRTGLFHGAQTLRQMLRAGSGACEVDAGRVEDRPDAPMRGVYAVGSWYDAAPPGNASFLNTTIDRMAEAKHSFIMFNANGGNILFSALRNPNSSSAQKTIQYYKHWQAYCADRGIELIPQINCGELRIGSRIFEISTSCTSTNLLARSRLERTQRLRER